MFRNNAPIPRDEARNLNAIVLSYVGDGVHTLYVRDVLTRTHRERAHALHERSVALVNAEAQARALERIEPVLTEEERGVYLRGRNCKNGSSSKNSSITDYRKATGYEALVGFLFLSGEDARLEQLLTLSFLEEAEKKE